MPVVHVYGLPRPDAARRKLARSVTEAVCRSYDVPPEIVTVYIFDVEKDHAAHGGVLISDAEALPPTAEA